VRTLKDGFADAHTNARGMVLTDVEGNRHIGPAIKFRNDPADPQLALPLYGEDNAVIAATGWEGEPTI
jgi:hypothetical protein